MPKRVASLLYTPEQAAALDRSQLASLGSSALIELDTAAAVTTSSATRFSSFVPLLVGSGAAGSLSGPRELLTETDVTLLNSHLDGLMRALRPYVLHRAGLKCLEFLLTRFLRCA